MRKAILDEIHNVWIMPALSGVFCGVVLHIVANLTRSIAFAMVLNRGGIIVGIVSVVLPLLMAIPFALGFLRRSQRPIAVFISGMMYGVFLLIGYAVASWWRHPTGLTSWFDLLIIPMGLLIAGAAGAAFGLAHLLFRHWIVLSGRWPVRVRSNAISSWLTSIAAVLIFVGGIVAIGFRHRSLATITSIPIAGLKSPTKPQRTTMMKMGTSGGMPMMVGGWEALGTIESIDHHPQMRLVICWETSPQYGQSAMQLQLVAAEGSSYRYADPMIIVDLDALQAERVKSSGIPESLLRNMVQTASDANWSPNLPRANTFGRFIEIEPSPFFSAASK